MMKPRTLIAETIVCYLICFALTALNVWIQPLGSPASDISWLAAVLSLIAVPTVAVRWIHRRDDMESGIVIKWSSRDFLWGIGAIALLIIPTALGNHAVRTIIQGLTFHFSWGNYLALPAPLWETFIIQLLCVAMPEELFFRGYLQTAVGQIAAELQKTKNAAQDKAAEQSLSVYQRRFQTLIPILISSAAFALIHLPSGDISRLLTFFPGLLFGFLRMRTGGLVGCIFCHALCNMMMHVMNIHYFSI